MKLHEKCFLAGHFNLSSGFFFYTHTQHFGFTQYFLFLFFLSSPSLNQGLLLEQERLMSDYDKVKAEEQEKDAKLQKLM